MHVRYFIIMSLLIITLDKKSYDTQFSLYFVCMPWCHLYFVHGVIVTV